MNVFKHLIEKLELVRQLNSESPEIVVGILVGGDLDVYGALLEDSSMSQHRFAPISTYSPSQEWINMLLLALEHGLQEADIVRHVNPMIHSYNGHGVEHFQGIIDSYAMLLEYDNKQVQDIGKSLVRHIEGHLESAKESEEQERSCQKIDRFQS